MTPVWRGKVIAGEFKPDRPEDFKRHLTNLEGHRIELIVERRRQKRSLPQNCFYFGVVIPLLAAHCGYDDLEEMHAILKEKFPVGADLAAYIEAYVKMEKVESSADFLKEQFQFYIERIQRLAAELGIYIPDPREVTSIAAEQLHEEP